MSKPTIRELLDSFRECKGEDRNLAIYEAEQLADRIEAMLKIAAKRHANEAYDTALRNFERILNGEQP